MTQVEVLARHIPAGAKEAAGLRTIVDFVSRHPEPFRGGGGVRVILPATRLGGQVVTRVQHQHGGCPKRR